MSFLGTDNTPTMKGVRRLGTVLQPLKFHDPSRKSYHGVLSDSADDLCYTFLVLSVKKNDVLLSAGDPVMFHITEPSPDDDSTDSTFDISAFFLQDIQQYEDLSLPDFCSGAYNDDDADEQRSSNFPDLPLTTSLLTHLNSLTSIRFRVVKRRLKC